MARKLNICKKRFYISDVFTNYNDTHRKKESEVAITPNAPIKADWDPAEQRVLSKTDELWYEVLSRD